MPSRVMVEGSVLLEEVSESRGEKVIFELIHEEEYAKGVNFWQSK